MKFNKIAIALISTLIASSGIAAQAKTLGDIKCWVSGVRYGTPAKGQVVLPVLDSREYNKRCPLFEDPEFGFGGECSIDIGRLSVKVAAINTDLEMTAEIAPIRVTANGSESVVLTLWDARHNTQHTVICSISR